MNEIPEVLTGVLRKGDYIESLEALRDFVARELECDYCSECERSGPRETKDTAALALRLTDLLQKINAAEGGAAQGPVRAPGTVTSIDAIQERSRAARAARTGAGTATTAAPTSVAKRQFGRRPGAGRHADS